MKKLFFAWIMALWCFPAVFAQSGQGIRYQGEVGVGTAFGVGSNAYDPVSSWKPSTACVSARDCSSAWVWPGTTIPPGRYAGR